MTSRSIRDRRRGRGRGALAGLVLAAAYLSAVGWYRRVHHGLTTSGTLTVGGRSLALMTLTLLIVGARGRRLRRGHASSP